MEDDKNVFSIIPSVILLVVFILFHPLDVNSESFQVRSSLSEDLREVLKAAESNGGDDIIFLNSGLYETGGEPFVFEAKDDFSLTLIGFDNSDCESCVPEPTVFSGDNQSRIFNIIGKPGITNIEFRNIVFSSGLSTEGGGGLQIFNAKSITIENCEFGGNRTFGNDNNTGGAFRLVGTAEDVLINNNSFGFNESSDSGAGIFISFAESITITNNNFNSNESGGFGGGAFLFGNGITVSNNIFKKNTSNRSGGGLDARGALNISKNQFIQNTAAMSGGGGYLISDELLLSKNQFVDNWSGESGGGIWVNAHFYTLCNGSFTNNLFNSNASEGDGGGLGISLWCDNFDYKITNNTFTFNTAGNDGGGISVIATADNLDFVIQTFTLDIYNNIIFSNSAMVNGGDIELSTFSGVDDRSKFKLHNNDFSDFYHCHHLLCEILGNQESEINQSLNIDLDPLFVDTESRDFSLQADSPCIDTGDPDAPDVPDTDILGNPRIPPPDMGAVEFIEEAVRSGGGCSMVHAPVSSSLAVFLALPVLIIIRRLVKRYRS